VTPLGLADALRGVDIAHLQIDGLAGSDDDLAVLVTACGQKLVALDAPGTAFGLRTAQDLATAQRSAVDRDAAADSPADPAAQRDAPLATRLERLDVSGTECDDAALAAIVAACPGLRFIAVWECAGVTSRGIAALARGCPQLETLDAEACGEVFDGAVVDIARGVGEKFYNLW
jgi:hypothetical protein